MLLDAVVCRRLFSCTFARSLVPLAGEKFKWDVKTRKVLCVVDRRNRRPLGEIYFYYRPSNIYVKSDVLRTAGKPVSTGHNCGIKLDALSAPRLTLNSYLNARVCLSLPELARGRWVHDTARDARLNSGRRHTFPVVERTVWYTQKGIYSCTRPWGSRNAVAMITDKS